MMIVFKLDVIVVIKARGNIELLSNVTMQVTC